MPGSGSGSEKRHVDFVEHDGDVNHSFHGGKVCVVVEAGKALSINELLNVVRQAGFKYRSECVCIGLVNLRA